MTSVKDARGNVKSRAVSAVSLQKPRRLRRDARILEIDAKILANPNILKSREVLHERMLGTAADHADILAPRHSSFFQEAAWRR